MVQRIRLPAVDSVDERTQQKAAKLFRQQGALWIENVFTRRFVGRISAAFAREYASLQPAELARRFALVGDGRYMISVDLKPPFLSPKLYANSGLMPILDDLIGRDCVISSFAAVVSFPGAADQPVHFDFPPLFESEQLCTDLPTYAITLVVPLVDLDEDTGWTAVWEGSHRRVGAREQLRQLSKSGAMTGAGCPRPKMGDVLLMDARLIHAGTANNSDRPRPILYIVYSRPWFRDQGNFAEQPAINISMSQLLKVPKKHQRLFDVARSSI